MYDTSFIGTLDTVRSCLERALAIETYRNIGTALRIRNDAVAALDDVSKLVSIALTNVELEGFERHPGDGAVREIIARRIDDGIDSKLPESAVERAHDAGRIIERGNTVFVPLQGEVLGSRNWWLLADALIGWLDELIDGYRRVYHRASLDAPELVETAFWTLLDRLNALRDALESALTVGRYVFATARTGWPDLIDGVGRIAVSIGGGTHA